MGWVLAALLAAAAFGFAAFALKAPRAGWEAIGAALALGIGGYALQARPGLAGAPTPAREDTSGDPADEIALRQAFAGGGPLSQDHWVMVADGLSRHGDYADAAGELLGAVGDNAKDAEAWLALANALVGHAEGSLTPAALYAYRRAAAAAPDQPGPPFFLGLALARSGRFDEARAQWQALLARAPASAPWRDEIALRLRVLDALAAEQQRLAGAAPPER